MTRPFEGVRVLEVAAWTFVPAAGAALADLGADVIKIEPPAGDPQRGLMNLLARAGGPGANPFVEIPNRGKRSMALAPAEVHELVQVEANGYLPELTSQTGARFRLPAPPMQFGGEAPAPRAPAPELGRHTEEILLELGRDWDAIAKLRDSGALGVSTGGRADLGSLIR